MGQPEMTLEEYEALVAEKRNALRKQPVKAANKSVEQDFAGVLSAACLLHTPGPIREVRLTD